MNEARNQELRNKIIAHYTKNFAKGVHFKTLGTDWTEATPVFEALWEEGVLVEVRLPSASGKRMMNKVILKTQAIERGIPFKS